MEKVYLEKRESFNYPDYKNYFAPSESYPEYPFAADTLSPIKNEVYDMVRTTLYGLGLDKEYYGTSSWNPLGKMLPKMGTVVLKPNWVRHFNGSGTMECMVTHPSIIRCMIDFCVVAGAGKIILGDAPVQGSDIHLFLEEEHYWDLQAFYAQRGVVVTIVDFRDLVVKVKHHIIMPSDEPRIGTREIWEYDLGLLSMHEAVAENEAYAICGYTHERIRALHSTSEHRHCYRICKEVLTADLILNLCKPKTHRYAGITGAQKNFVGICPDKQSLPHLRAGSQRENGDESNIDSWYNRFQWRVYEKCFEFCRNRQYLMAYFASATNAIFSRTNKQYHYTKGSWHGNDTIWRTILDLNLLLRYTDKSACFSLSHSPRSILTIGDMIIAGEKNGPLEPQDKPLGIILGSTNCAAFDAIFCKIAGYDINIIPTVRESCRNERLLPGGASNIHVCSNLDDFNNKSFAECSFPVNWRFQPHVSWQEFLDSKGV